MVQRAFGHIHHQHFRIHNSTGNRGLVVLCRFDWLEMKISNVLTFADFAAVAVEVTWTSWMAGVLNGMSRGMQMPS